MTPWTDRATTLAEVQAELARFNAQRDWQRYHSPRNLAMALSVESGELLELFLWCADDGPQPALEGRRARVAHEAADVLINLLNLCRALDLDLLAAAQAKLALNAEKYPVGRVAGRMEKYDEYEP